MLKVSINFETSENKYIKISYLSQLIFLLIHKSTHSTYVCDILRHLYIYSVQARLYKLISHEESSISLWWRKFSLEFLKICRRLMPISRYPDVQEHHRIYHSFLVTAKTDWLPSPHPSLAAPGSYHSILNFLEMIFVKFCL